MPSYLGYKEVDKGYVDYASIAKDLSDTLAANKKEKQEKRQELEDATRETINKLGQYQEGRNQTANNIFYDFADNSKKALFELNKQLKAGGLTYNEYKKAYQNLQDGTAEIKTNLATWNQKYAELEERQRSKNGKLPEGSEIELFMAQQYGGLLDLQKSMFYTDPVSLRVYHGQKGEDGQLIQGSIRDVLTINNKQNSRFDRVDIQGSLDGYTDKIAKYELISTATGYILKDASLRPDFKKFRNDVVTAILGNNRSMASILADNTDDYTLTTDVNKKGDDKFIVLEYDGNSIIQPSLTKKQEEAARGIVERAFDQRIERGMGETAESRARFAKGRETKSTFDLFVRAMAGDSGAQTDLINRKDIGISSIKFDTPVEGQEGKAKMRITTSDGKVLVPVDLFRRTSDGELARDENNNPIRKKAEELAESAMNASGIADIADIEEIVRETPSREAATKVDVKETPTAPDSVTKELGVVLAADTEGDERLKALESSINILLEDRLPGYNFRVDTDRGPWLNRNRTVTLSSEIPGVEDVTFNIKQDAIDITKDVNNFIKTLWSKTQDFSEAKKGEDEIIEGDKIFKKTKGEDEVIGNEILKKTKE